MITASYFHQRHIGQVDSPAFPWRFTTIMAQAAAGSFFGSFLVGLVWILYRYDRYNGLLALSLPFVLAFGLAAGTPSGFLFLFSLSLLPD